ncbi:Nuclear transport factor 2 [Phytophthora cinnamomi]|uniref:Nuclear transport factor 2 n=1 Tax=Phytophthora cinnamomi TaxID=4785 RepID=UPI0035593E90|nr:Nuclear transport factor 2 [Phytophthora cinnamomi]
MSAEEVAKAFVQHYYTTFDTNRAGLLSLYQDVSNLSWEGQLTTGQQAIMAKLQGLPTVRHEYPTLDIQPSTSGNAMIIFVQGKIQIEENNPIQFTQVFQLVAHQPGQYYIHNDVFRLQYG